MAAGEVVVNVDFGYFEEDVIAEILPVKSLKRFRCVCKPWCALISASYFVKKHLSFQDRGITESPRRLIINLDPALAFDCEARIKTTEALQSDDDDVHGQFAVIPLDFPVKNNRNVVRHIGSCNGLVCVHVEFTDGMVFNDLPTHCKSLILWNPCTRNFTALPNPPRQFYCSRYFHGLGYDSVNDDYKVIQGFVSYSDGTKKIMIYIFSLKTGSWKPTVKDIDYVSLETDKGLFVNGALHWLSNLPDGSGSSIVSFDLGAEEFQKTVPLPSDDWFSGPFIHSNCLCVCSFPTETNCINLWMMKEYGVKESWTQVVQFSLENEICRKYWRPVCILENGVVFIDISGTHKGLVVLSNLKDKTIMHCVEAQDNCFETVIYQETLVSPRLYDPWLTAKPNI